MFFSHMSPIGTEAASSTYMPGSEIVPPIRTSGKQAASADSLPTASTTTSAPRQFGQLEHDVLGVGLASG